MKDELFDDVGLNVYVELAHIDSSVKLEVIRLAVKYSETLDTNYLTQVLFICKAHSVALPPTIVSLQDKAFKIENIKNKLPKIKANTLFKKSERDMAYEHVHLLVEYCGLMKSKAIERSCARLHERHKKVHDSLGTKIFQNLSTFESDYFKWERKKRSALKGGLNLNIKIKKTPDWTSEEISDFLHLFPDNVDSELC